MALLSVLRYGMLRRSEAAARIWGNVELRDNGTALINVRRSKPDPEAERVTLYTGPRPAGELLDQNTSVFGLSPRPTERRVSAAADAAGLGDAFTGHSGRLGMGPGPGRDQRRSARAHDRRPVEELHHASTVY